jgi:hypothetical protein
MTKRKTIRSISEFVEQVSTLRPTDKDELVYYRGQKDCYWKCVPSIARAPYNADAIYDGRPTARSQAEWVLFGSLAPCVRNFTLTVVQP